MEEEWPDLHVSRLPPDPRLIERSAHQLVEIADRFGYAAVFLPRPGAGAGGLDYHTQVKPVIEDILLGDRFAIVSY